MRDSERRKDRCEDLKPGGLSDVRGNPGRNETDCGNADEPAVGGVAGEFAGVCAFAGGPCRHRYTPTPQVEPSGDECAACLP
jgi:hypothetical protein